MDITAPPAIDDALVVNETKTPAINHVIPILNELDLLIPQLYEHRPSVLNDLRTKLCKILAKVEDQRGQREDMRCDVNAHNHRRTAEKQIKTAKKNGEMQFVLNIRIINYNVT